MSAESVMPPNHLVLCRPLPLRLTLTLVKPLFLFGPHFHCMFNRLTEQLNSGL